MLVTSMETILKTFLSRHPVSRAARAAASGGGLAVAAFLAAGLPAHAQSSVTIYGIIDQGLSKANNGTTPAALLPGRAAGDAWNLKAGNTSRLGFRGTEDLGGGNYTRFQLEHRFVADTGAPSNANVFWLGRSVVALGGSSWGEVYAGREYSPAFWLSLNADPTYLSYVSQLGTPYSYANYTAVASTVEASNIRWANTVGYKSPNWGGVTFELATALGEGLRGRNDSGNVQYKRGPVWLGLAFDRLDSRNNLTLLAGGYDFGVVYPTFSYARAKGGLNGDATSFSVSANMPTSFGRVYVNYGRLRPATHLDSTMLGLGGEYTLSKRTLLYANLGSARRVGLTRATAIDFGVKHAF